MFNKFLKLTLLPVLFAGIVAMQLFYDSNKAKAVYSEPNVLKSDVVKAVDLGLDNAISDLMWLAAIQYVGGNQTHTYEKLPDYLNLATDLDPKFSYPCAFGVLIMPGLNQVDQAIALGQKGIEKSKPDWRIPYYMATTYFIEKKDNNSATKYFDLAARVPGAPSNIQTIAANFGTRPDIREQTRQIWLGIYETTKDEIVRDRARAYISHYDILDFLEQAAIIYKQKNGAYPSKISDLVNGGILKAIPPDPFALNFAIDSTTGHVSAMSY